MVVKTIEVIYTIYGTTDIIKILITHRSHFIKSLIQLLPFFQISCSNSVWKWTPTGAFSMASTYKVMADTGVISSYSHILGRSEYCTRLKKNRYCCMIDFLHSRGYIKKGSKRDDGAGQVLLV
jgi:hypothetical protein